jgi:hypothetical protein
MYVDDQPHNAQISNLYCILPWFLKYPSFPPSSLASIYTCFYTSFKLNSQSQLAEHSRNLSCSLMRYSCGALPVNSRPRHLSSHSAISRWVSLINWTYLCPGAPSIRNDIRHEAAKEQAHKADSQRAIAAIIVSCQAQRMDSGSPQLIRKLMKLKWHYFIE